MKVLVTGAAGYIGSHTCLELIAAGHEVVGLDNLSNSSAESLKRVEQLCGKPVPLHVVDLLDAPGLAAVFDSGQFDAVIHFAGLKAVGESVALPLKYFRNNVEGTLRLLDEMRRRGLRRLVFSSSATVYGDPAKVPVTEDMPLSATNPYGRSKLMVEDICRDFCRAEPSFTVALLRYFNPVGAHPSGLIGEDPRGTPNNLMPYVMQVAVGRRPFVTVHGSDYPTPDGTGVRDYLHVVDLARGHVAAVNALPSLKGCQPFNLGTGKGASVLEVIAAASAAAGKQIAYQLGPRRPGDVATTYADPDRAKKLLGWRAELSLERMCIDSWRWQSTNPQGYERSR